MDSLPPWPVVWALLSKVVLPGVGVGAGFLAVVCALDRLGGRRGNRSERVRLFGAAVALVSGWSAGNAVNDLVPWWSVEPGWTSLFPATLAALVGGLVAALVSGTDRSVGGLVWRLAALAIGGAWLTAGGQAPWARLGSFLLLFLSSALNLEAFRRDGRRALDRFALPALAMPWGLAAAIVLIHAHSARFFDLAVLLTATLAGVGLVAAWQRVDATALMTGPALYFPGLIVSGADNTFSEVPRASFILIAVAPAALWSLRLPPLREWAGRRLAVASVIALLIPCTAAVVLAMRAESLDFGE